MDNQMSDRAVDNAAMHRRQSLKPIFGSHYKQTYIQFCRVEEQRLIHFDSFRNQVKDVMRRLKRECPTVTWQLYYLTGGPADLVSTLQSDHALQLERAFRFVRDMDGLTTQYWVVTDWKAAEEFLPQSGR